MEFEFVLYKYALVGSRETVVESLRFDRAAYVVPTVVPERDTTRRVPVVLAVRRPAVVPDVAARAVVLVRGVTRRVVVVDCVVGGAARAVDDVLAGVRATTLRAVVFGAALVRASTLICAPDCDGVTPGFNWVRMVLFIYGYRLLYVFALT